MLYNVFLCFFSPAFVLTDFFFSLVFFSFPHLLQDLRLSALIFDKLQVPDYLQKNRNEGESRCEICATHLNQLKQEAIQMIHTLNQASYQEITDAPQSSASVTSVLPRMVTVSSQRDLPLVAGQVGRQSGKTTNLFSGTERKKGLGWPQGTGNFPNSSVQVTVAPSGLSGALSSVTIQAQQYLEGMWSISRVNSFLPQACLVSTDNSDEKIIFKRISSKWSEGHLNKSELKNHFKIVYFPANIYKQICF